MIGRELITTGLARGCQGRGVVVRVHSPSALIPQRLIGVRKRLFAWFASGFCGVLGVPTSTTCKSWWGASLRSWFQCIRLLHRTCKTSRGTSLRSWLKCTRLSCKSRRGTSLRSWFKCTRLWHRTCKTSHGTSLRSWFQKSAC